MDMRNLSGRGSIYHHLPWAQTYLSASQEVYTSPQIPVDIPDYQNIVTDGLKFGGEQSRQLFIMDQNFTLLNHGARGCTLKKSLDVSQAYQRYMDSQPLRAKDRELVPLLCHVIREMGEFVGCEPRDLFMTNNVTHGVNTVLQSLIFKPGDIIATLNIGYGGVAKAVSAVCERTGAKHQIINLHLPLTDDHQILESIREQLNDDIRLIIIDHIPPAVPYLMPLKHISDICRQRGILVMVDGAQTLGNIDIDITSYGADFYVTNCHKWFCNTRGSALTYVRRELQPQIKPLVVSWGHQKGFAAEFIFSGTQYYSQHVSLLSTLMFWRNVGGDNIRKYCRNTLTAAAELLSTSWKVEPYPNDHRINMMALVRLPDRLNDKNWKTQTKNKPLLITNWLYNEHKIEVKIRELCGALYIRLSCHIYNNISDYERLAEAVLDLCQKRDIMVDYDQCFHN